jgi:RNA polymerase sigma-70 factor (ECF subfamily)
MRSSVPALEDLASPRLVAVAGGEAGERESSPDVPLAPVRDPARLRAMLEAHYDLVWRSLRRFGVRAGDVDDAAQQVFLVAARKLDAVEPGAERSFLVGTAMRVASDARRAASRRREVQDDEPLRERRDSSPGPEELADRRRARALLDEVLDAMPLDLRAVFVLFELEELPTAEIAALVGVPVGTAASRLRRAREEFHRIAARMRARAGHAGGAS